MPVVAWDVSLCFFNPLHKSESHRKPLSHGTWTFKIEAVKQQCFCACRILAFWTLRISYWHFSLRFWHPKIGIMVWNRNFHTFCHDFGVAPAATWSTFQANAASTISHNMSVYCISMCLNCSCLSSVQWNEPWSTRIGQACFHLPGCSKMFQKMQILKKSSQPSAIPRALWSTCSLGSMSWYGSWIVLGCSPPLSAHRCS